MHGARCSTACVWKPISTVVRDGLSFGRPSRNDKSRHFRRLLRKASDVADFVVGFGPAASNAERVRAGGAANVVGFDTYEDVRAFLSELPPSLVILKSNKSTTLKTIWDAVDPESATRTPSQPVRIAS